MKMGGNDCEYFRLANTLKIVANNADTIFNLYN